MKLLMLVVMTKRSDVLLLIMVVLMVMVTIEIRSQRLCNGFQPYREEVVLSRFARAILSAMRSTEGLNNVSVSWMLYLLRLDIMRLKFFTMWSLIQHVKPDPLRQNRKCLPGQLIMVPKMIHPTESSPKTFRYVGACELRSNLAVLDNWLLISSKCILIQSCTVVKVKCG